MKTILICPNQASGISVLADRRPLATLPFLGETFIGHWMQHLANEKIREVRLITTDPVSAIEEYTGNGSRWGIRLEVFHEVRELTPGEARKRYRPAYETEWPADPGDVIIADHFPTVPGHKLFASYGEWFRAFSLWLPQIASSNRVGLREIQPGVWMGRRGKIAQSARFIAPCWLGENVQIEAGAVVGPMAFLEDQVVLDRAAAVSHSWVGPETFLGQLTELKDSLAWGSLLINWKSGSHTIIPDHFLMASLAEGRETSRKPVAARQSSLARPFSRVVSFAQKLQG